MPIVEIVQMGPPTQGLNLRAVAKNASRVQDHFQFVVGDPINHLGQPNSDGEYAVTDLAAPLEQRRRQNATEIEIGVTDAPLREGFFSAVDRDSNNIVISLAPVENLLPKINKSKTDYVLLEIAAQLLAIDYRRQVNLSAEPEECEVPWHRETRSCVFDYCDNPPETLKKLMAPKLCAECRSLLESANIRQSVIKACLNIVKKAVYAKFLNVLRGVLTDPIGRMLFGSLGMYILLKVFNKVGVNDLNAPLLVLVLLLLVILRQMRRSRVDLE